MVGRTASAKPILPRNEMKTAIPPNGVTARCVSRRISRSFDNRAMISGGAWLSLAPLTIRVPKGVLERIEILAKLHGKPVANIIRELLSEALDKRSPELNILESI